MNVGFDGADRLVDNKLDTDGGGQVINVVRPIQQAEEQRRVVDRPLVKSELGMFRDGAQVLFGPGRKVVDHDHLVAPRQKRLAQVTSDKPRTPGD